LAAVGYLVSRLEFRDCDTLCRLVVFSARHIGTGANQFELVPIAIDLSAHCRGPHRRVRDQRFLQEVDETGAYYSRNDAAGNGHNPLTPVMSAFELHILV